jgi:hypothetical protein
MMDETENIDTAKAGSKTMDELKSQLKKLDEELKKATTTAAKDKIKVRQEDLKRQLKGMEKK